MSLKVLAWRVYIPELLAGSEQVPKAYPSPNQQGTQRREGHDTQAPDLDEEHDYRTAEGCKSRRVVHRR